MKTKMLSMLDTGYFLINYCAFHKHLNFEVFWCSKANWHLRFSLPSIILAHLLGNRSFLQRVQKVMFCDWSISIHFVCFKVRYLWSLLWLTAAKNVIANVTWDQALFSFRFVNNIPADKAKRKEIQTFYETSAAHFFDWLTFAESANQNHFRCTSF